MAGRNDAADGLRGIAAINVALSHFVAAFWPSLLRYNYDGFEKYQTPMSIAEKILSSPPITLFFNGHFPVLVFFVLSGFLLASPAMEDRYDLIRARAIGRYFRLNIPIAAACFFSWLLLEGGFYFNIEAAAVSSSQWLENFYTHSVSLGELLNIVEYRGILGDGTLVPPLWTLKVEFLGSLLLLAAICLSPPRKAYAGLILAALGILISRSDDQIYYLAFLAGASLNWLKPKGYLALGCLFVGFFFGAYQNAALPYLWLPTVRDAKSAYNCIGAVLVVAGTCTGSKAPYPLSNPVSLFLGRISFSLYLFHFPILTSVACFVICFMGNGLIGLLSALVIYLGIAIAVALVATKTVDAPAIQFGHWFAFELSKQSRAKKM
ncbi:acyltransferase family protein [Rhizobium tropici]|uniref:acyltransferase family protein n=1 Tax=Rhizobium tropici TaxID=398 RepID=UPI00165F894C|nr:acyltransferase [Rhizobium tropici]